MNGIERMIANAVNKAYKIRYQRYFYNELMGYQNKAVIPIKELTSEQKKEIKEYYASFGFKGVRTDWHRYIYSITGEFSPKMIPEDLFHNVLERIYNVKGLGGWEDKAFMPFILKDVRFPETVCCRVNGYYFDDKRNLISKDTAMDMIRNCESAVAKPTLASGGGRGVMMVNPDHPEEILKDMGGSSFIVQKTIKQSPETAVFNPSSVNTEKVLSFLFKGEVHILSAHMRVGAPGSLTDNASGGQGYIFRIDEDGQTGEYGVNLFGKKTMTDYYGETISGRTLSHHSEILGIIKKAHKRFPYFGFMSWDFCVNDKDEPVLIEYNTGSPEALAYQITTGPLFGDMTDEVLSDAATKIDRIRYFK